MTDNSEEIDIAEIERNMTELTKTWNDKFVEALLGAHGEAQARNLEQKYSDGLVADIAKRICHLSQWQTLKSLSLWIMKIP